MYVTLVLNRTNTGWASKNYSENEYTKSLTRTRNVSKIRQNLLYSTKLFIQFPKTLFDTEDAFQMKKHEIAAIIQSKWKCILARRKYLKIREAAIVFQKYTRRWFAKREAEKRKNAVIKIRRYCKLILLLQHISSEVQIYIILCRFIEGFITRNGPPTEINMAFIELAKYQWLIKLSKTLPKGVLNNYWPPCPYACREVRFIINYFYPFFLK